MFVSFHYRQDEVSEKNFEFFKAEVLAQPFADKLVLCFFGGISEDENYAVIRTRKNQKLTRAEKIMLTALINQFLLNPIDFDSFSSE